jgi:cytochrome c
MTRPILFCAVISVLKPNVAHLQKKGSGESASKAENIFHQCSGCHSVDTDKKKVGPSLKGLFKKEKLLHGRPATEANIRLVIRRGGDGMPAFDGFLSSGELDRLVAFLKRY